MTSYSTRNAFALLGFFALPFSALAQTSPTPATTVPTSPAAAAPSAPVTTPAVAAPARELLLAPKLAPSDYQNYLKQRYTADRKALAAIHMFGKHHTGGLIWLGAGAGFLALFATQAGTHDTGSGGSYTVTISPLGYVVFVGLPAVLGISKLSRFNKEAMYKAFLDYDKTGTFPGYVATRVRSSDY